MDALAKPSFLLTFNIEHSTFNIQHLLLTREMARSAQSLTRTVTPKSAVRLIVEPLTIAIVLALCVRTALRLYVIPSTSMLPTLVPGDHIVVTPYRFQGAPKRGDIVVFRSTRADDELMIKRIIGIPGDLVETRAGRIVISGHALPEPYVAAPATTGAVAPQIVPADSYFVLGDNRADSVDSRSWGVLPHDRVVGQARLVLWSSEGDVARQGSGVAAARSSTRGVSTSGHPSRLFKLIQ